MINVVRILIFGFASFFLALATSLENVDSFVVDFTKIPQRELQFFKFAMFVIFVALMLAMIYVGGRGKQ